MKDITIFDLETAIKYLTQLRNIKVEFDYSHKGISIEGITAYINRIVIVDDIMMFEGKNRKRIATIHLENFKMFRIQHAFNQTYILIDLYEENRYNTLTIWLPKIKEVELKCLKLNVEYAEAS